jgi:hypothetical protein
MRLHGSGSTLRSLARGSRRGLGVLALGALGLQVATAGAQLCSSSAGRNDAGAGMTMMSAPHDMEESAPRSPMQHSGGGATLIMSGCTTCALTSIIAIASVSDSRRTHGTPASSTAQLPHSWSLAPDVPPPRA